MTKIIDAHIHYHGDHPDALALLEELGLKLLNVCVAHGSAGAWRERRATAYQALAAQYPERYAWVTTFDPPDVAAEGFDAVAFAGATIQGLETDFANGAVACKFWKNIGMELRKPDGGFLMIDDPVFDPIFDYLTGEGKPALMHIGEPLGCWLPLDENNPHRGYYSQEPEWYMGDKPWYPSHADLIGARDRVLARHPDLTVIGAHLGSLEYDVAELAARLDRYPAFAVDTSARLHDLLYQDRDTVRQFFIDYQDRLLFGTDVVVNDPVSALDDAARAAHLASMRARYEQDVAYYATGAEMTIGGRATQGLHLPSAVMDKLLVGNARRWYDGL